LLVERSAPGSVVLTNTPQIGHPLQAPFTVHVLASVWFLQYVQTIIAAP
jgi:hypothetical protein